MEERGEPTDHPERVGERERKRARERERERERERDDDDKTIADVLPSRTFQPGADWRHTGSLRPGIDRMQGGGEASPKKGGEED